MGKKQWTGQSIAKRASNDPIIQQSLYINPFFVGQWGCLRTLVVEPWEHLLMGRSPSLLLKTINKNEKGPPLLLVLVKGSPLWHKRQNLCHEHCPLATRRRCATREEMEGGPPTPPGRGRR